MGDLYDFLFREYSPAQGHWISPDPAGLAAVDITNPQSWNRYAYVGNRPTSLTDPKGLCGRCLLQFPAAVPDPLAFGGGGDAIFGNDIFDAITGAPGTYLTVDMYGNVGFGFSIPLYNQTENLIDAERAGVNDLGLDPGLVPTSGFVVVQQNNGTPDINSDYLTSGLVPSLNAIAAAQQQLVAMLPGEYQSNYAYLLRNPNDGDPLTQVLGQFATADPAGFSRLVPYVQAFASQQAALVNELSAFFSAPFPQY